jgi:Ca2+-transporting ATPase
MRRTWIRIVADVLREPMFALLLAGGAIYLLLGSSDEALVLLIFATLSVSIAVAQDLRSEHVLEALRSLASPRALVLRDGQRLRIPGRDVVRGDIMIVSEGDRIAADGVVRDTTDLRVDEAILTGESAPVTKRGIADADTTKAQPGGDDSPHVFSGTLVVGGQGVVEVTATGLRSQIGAIGASLREIHTEPPRTAKEIRRLVQICGTIGIAASLGTTILYGLLRGGWLDGLLAGIAIGMSLLPEEFPLVLTVFMVMGAWRISKARVLTRRPAAIEYLGAATVLCTDKTGTLTQNRMQIAAIATRTALTAIAGGAVLPQEFHDTLRLSALASPRVTLDPMETAIHALAAEVLGGRMAANETPIHTYPLRPELMAMSQVWQENENTKLVAAKGACEAIIRLCRLEDQDAAQIRSRADGMAAQGMRVIGIARASVDIGAALPDDHLGLQFEYIGLLGLSDPLREAVPGAIRECRSAGIRVMMITGDYPTTAQAIARQAGIEGDAVIVGSDIDTLDDASLAKRLTRTNVCARITPLQKLRIVSSLKASGEIVAMTGDGVNDAPSLKAADIGIAMGGRGTDVAREAASIVLLDDDFASIVAAVRLGRRIYDNLRKAISFIIAVHIPIAGLALLPLTFGLPLLLFPVHIAFLEMIIDPVCSLAFEAEREESDVMRRPPRPVDQHMFTGGMLAWALLQGVTALVLTFGLYLVALHQGVDGDKARAIAFGALIAVNVSLILVNRSFHRRSVFATLVRENHALWTVFSIVAVALILVLTVPAVRALFKFGRLNLPEMAAVLGVGVASLIFLNVCKAFAPLARRRVQLRS